MKNYVKESIIRETIDKHGFSGIDISAYVHLGMASQDANEYIVLLNTHHKIREENIFDNGDIERFATAVFYELKFS
jgi:hypothetical protein